jgi:DNA-directed RNA polymerase specialized sigma24 family protein
MSKTVYAAWVRSPAGIGSADWVVHARDRIAAVLINRGWPADGAEDAAQHAALKAIEMGEALKARDDAFLYLLAAALNHLRDRRRRDGRLGSLSDEPTAIRVKERATGALASLLGLPRVLDRKAWEIVHEAVAGLDRPEYRRIIDLYYFVLQRPSDKMLGLILQSEGLIGAKCKAPGQRARRSRKEAESQLRALILQRRAGWAGIDLGPIPEDSMADARNRRRIRPASACLV